ncbi:Belongs to the cyclin [Dionaea muscipula]
MAVISQQQEADHITSSSSFLLDALYCEEEEEEEEAVVEERGVAGEEERWKKSIGISSQSLLPLLFLEQDFFWEDEELVLLLAKEEKQQQKIQWLNVEGGGGSLGSARRGAVEWMLKVNAHHGFSTLTAILAINYLDRFLSTIHFQKDKPWMIQLAAVTCLSLAAKVEESQAPLLLDLQVHGTKCLFDPKTIQKMELLVLSSLEWKMHPVTPLSFFHHIITRLGLKTHMLWEFLRRCDRLLLSLVSDSRLVSYPPSVLATATMLRVIDQIEPLNPLDYQNQLLGVLNESKGKVIRCYQLIIQATGSSIADEKEMKGRPKRKHEKAPSSPSGVIDGYFSCESSNDSWAAIGSSVSSSPLVPAVMKKTRVNEQHMPLPSLSRVFVEAARQTPS